MLRLGAAAAADQVDAVLGDEALLPLRQLLRRQRIMRVAVMKLGQAGIGLDRDAAGPAFGQPFDVLGHFLRAGGAIDADERHLERVDHRRGGGDVRADQQRPGGLDRDLHEDRRIAPRLGAGGLGGVDRRLHLQRVLAGLDQDGIGAAIEETAALDGERGLERRVIDMAQRRQTRARPNRADDEARAPVAAEFGHRLARQLGGAAIEPIGLVGDAELAERQRRAAEAIGLNRVGAGGEIAAMDVEDEIRTALVENFRTVLVASVILVEAERHRLHSGAGRAVAQQDVVG